MSKINFSYIVYRKDGKKESEFNRLIDAENYVRSEIDWENEFGCGEPDSYEIIRKITYA